MMPKQIVIARRPVARGFTLAELLVVIGIITILAAILLPVVSRVRNNAHEAATKARVQAIMAAIDNYYGVFNAYPGPVSDPELMQATANSYGQPFQQILLGSGTMNQGSLPSVTGTENLTLGLLGGLTLTNAQKTFQPPFVFSNFVYTDVGSGPLNLNPLKAVRYGPFINPTAGGLEPQGGNLNGGWVPWSNSSHPNGPVQYASMYADTFVPEFTDAYPDALPILYLRAVPGASGSIVGAEDTTNTNGVVNASYDPSQLQPYLFPAFVGVGSGQAAIGTMPQIPIPGPPMVYPGPPYNTAAGTPDSQVLHDFPNPQFYFGLANSPSQPRSKGGYLLITAGPDRKFLTADDSINGSRAQ